MANKTRGDIINQVYQYIPQMNVDSHGTALDTLIDIAAEEISSRYNFSYFQNVTPASTSISAGSYTETESNFASFTNMKEILQLEWIKSDTGEHGTLKWMPFRAFLKRYPYHDYSNRTRGKPDKYTKAGSTIILNRPADEGISLRAWYQQLHGAFAADTTTHSFEPNMLGFQAIVSCVLNEAHDLIPGIEMSKKAMQEMAKKEAYIAALIDADKSKVDEPFEMSENADSPGIAPEESPYGWVS